MKNRVNKILLICSSLIFLIIFPYTKKIEVFKVNDVNWDLINTAITYKKFDPKIFSFKNTYEISDKLMELNNKEITISGFIKHIKHKDHNDIILTESITDVCFMCDHDEHYSYINISESSIKTELNDLKNDTFIKLKGIFIIHERDDHSLFHLKNAEIVEIISNK